MEFRRCIPWMPKKKLLDCLTSRLTRFVQKRDRTSSGSELCDMDYTKVETRRKFSDADNPLLFMRIPLERPPSAYRRIPILSVWSHRSESAGKFPDRLAPERYPCCLGLRMESKLPKNVINCVL